MKFRLLTTTDQEIYGASAMATVDYTDVAAMGASLTGNVAVAPGTTNGLQPAVGTSGTDAFPAPATGNPGPAIQFKFAVVDTPFVSSTATSLTVSVGDTGSATRFLAASQIQSTASPIVGAVSATNPYYAGAAEVVNAYFTSITGNLNTFTAGSMRLFFNITDLGQLPKA